MDAGNFTGLSKEGLRERLHDMSSWGMLAFSVVLLLLLVLAAIFF